MSENRVRSLTVRPLKKCYTFRQIVFLEKKNRKTNAYKPRLSLCSLPIASVPQMLHWCNIFGECLITMRLEQFSNSLKTKGLLEDGITFCRGMKFQSKLHRDTSLKPLSPIKVHAIFLNLRLSQFYAESSEINNFYPSLKCLRFT